MNHPVKIKSALVSVYYKDKLEPLVQFLKAQGVQFYSTGGTQTFLEEQGASVTAVEILTDYPAIFGGILHRRGLDSDTAEVEKYEIPTFDLVIVDLYPFEETVASGASEQEIIE